MAALSANLALASYHVSTAASATVSTDTGRWSGSRQSITWFLDWDSVLGDMRHTHTHFVLKLTQVALGPEFTPATVPDSLAIVRVSGLQFQNAGYRGGALGPGADLAVMNLPTTTSTALTLPEKCGVAVFRAPREARGELTVELLRSSSGAPVAGTGMLPSSLYLFQITPVDA